MDIATRIAKLHQSIDAAIEKAKRTGKPRIPGDGDGDGIPYEGRSRGKGPAVGSSPGSSAEERSAIATFAARNLNIGRARIKSLAGALSGTQDWKLQDFKDTLQDAKGYIQSQSRTNPEAKKAMDRIATANQIAMTATAGRPAGILNQRTRTNLAAALEGKIKYNEDGDLVRA